ncbi:tetratricopeptide repeat protein [Haliscomenobacter sp.]|uniref:tetratricopeptide repeat protein n=1 Tax=Haliscomenobacter sp. TaxID=2717303 RepID=UPI003BAD4738
MQSFSKIILSCGLSILSFSSLLSQDCATQIVPPVLSEAARSSMEEKLAAAKAAYELAPNSADALIWYGRRTAYLGRYSEAIEIYTRGMSQHPTDARLYRHRGHRYLSIRCIDKALADFKKAYALTRRKPDEIEPDGMPNAKGIPTSTLQSNIRYHLGLCLYLKGQFKEAARYYKEDLRKAANPDMYVASANWLYLCYRRLGADSKAQKLLKSIEPDMALIENFDYLKILLLHKDGLNATKLKEEIAQPNSLSNSTVSLGLANYYLLNGQKEEAERLFKLITEGNQWASFAYITAEVELGRMK